MRRCPAVATALVAVATRTTEEGDMPCSACAVADLACGDHFNEQGDGAFSPQKDQSVPNEKAADVVNGV
jgi:hypothetical protein